MANTLTIIDSEAISNELLRFTNIDSMLELLQLDFDKYNEVGEIMRQFNTDWDNAPCDPEGATEDQDLFMDQLLENASNELLQLLA